MDLETFAGADLRLQRLAGAAGCEISYVIDMPASAAKALPSSARRPTYIGVHSLPCNVLDAENLLRRAHRAGTAL